MDKLKMKKKLKGLIVPILFNSNGKAIGFEIQSLCGSKFKLQADNLLKKLRKNIYKTAEFIGEHRESKGKEYYLVRNILT